MKRKGIKKIALKKSIISNFTTDNVKGGSGRTSNLCSAVCTGQCPPATNGCFTLDNASACICE